MANQSFGQKLLGVWNTRTIVTVAIGAALFGVLMNYGGIPIFTNTSLTTAMIVPVVVGALYGPVPAMVAAGLGNVIADLIGGWGLWFDWSIGNAVAALFVGALPLYGIYISEGVFSWKKFIIYVILCVLGNAIAFGIVTPVFSTIIYASDLNVTFLQAIWASIGNIIVEIVAGAIVLPLLAKRNASRQNLEEE